MLLTVNAGNSHITLGCTEDDRVLFLERISTNLNKTGLEYAIDLMNTLRRYGLSVTDTEGAIIASVVPQLNSILSEAVRRVFPFDPVIVSASETRLLKIAIDDPKELGANFVVNTVAALHTYGAPVIIIDMGTATSIGITDAGGTFLGTAILPGLQSSLDALSGGTAQLPTLSPGRPVTALGRNTADCMNGGSVYGNAGMIDAVIDRMTEELKLHDGASFRMPKIVATGKYADVLTGFFRHDVIYDDHLSVRGLSLIWESEKEAAE